MDHLDPRGPARQHLHQAAARQFGADEHAGQLHHAHTGQGRIAQRQHGRSHQARLVAHLGALLVRPQQHPAVAVLGLAHVQAGPARQVHGPQGRTHALQQRRAGHQALVALGQLAQHQLAVLQRRRAHADRQIQPLGHHVHTAVGLVHLQAHPRVLGHERRQHRPHARRQQRHRAAQAHHAAGLAVRQGHGFLGRRRLGQHGAAVLVVALAQFGHGKAARGAQQQLRAQALFQQGDVPAELGLGDAQGPPRRGETAVLHDQREVVQGIQIREFHRFKNGTLHAIFAVYPKNRSKFKIPPMFYARSAAFRRAVHPPGGSPVEKDSGCL